MNQRRTPMRMWPWKHMKSGEAGRRKTCTALLLLSGGKPLLLLLREEEEEEEEEAAREARNEAAQKDVSSSFSGGRGAAGASAGAIPCLRGWAWVGGHILVWFGVGLGWVWARGKLRPRFSFFSLAMPSTSASCVVHTPSHTHPTTTTTHTAPRETKTTPRGQCWVQLLAGWACRRCGVVPCLLPPPFPPPPPAPSSSSTEASSPPPKPPAAGAQPKSARKAHQPLPNLRFSSWTGPPPPRRPKGRMKGGCLGK